MSEGVFKKGIHYFKKNGFQKSCTRTIQFFTEKKSYIKLLEYTTPTAEQLEAQRREQFAVQPKISIIIPMYNTPIAFFQKLIECVQAQTYGNWELCLADGTGKETESSAYVQELMNKETRIRYKMLDSNDGISENTNRALELATGEFVVLMDHDDIITPDALYRVVKAINENPQTDSIYTDEDKMDMEGVTLFEPHFKPDFNVDYLRNCNYICHMFIVRTSIAREIGGFRKEFDGAQDFDFIFRCTEKSRVVAHIPRVLYHWRCHINSTAAVPESKLYAYDSGVKSIEEHFKRTGVPMKASMGASYGYYKNSYILEQTPKVTVIIHGGRTEQNPVLSYENRETLYCDADSKAINEAVRKANGEYILLLDGRYTAIEENVLEELLGYAQREDVAAAAAKTFGSDDSIYHAGLVMGIEHSFGFAFRHLDSANKGYYMMLLAPHDVSGVDLSCTLYRKSVWEQAGGLAEDMQPVYAAADLSLKITELNHRSAVEGRSAGTAQSTAGCNAYTKDMYKMVYVPYAACVLDAVTDAEWHDDTADRQFTAKWKDKLAETDIYYNCNLSRKGTDFTILSSVELKEMKKANKF